MRSPSTISGFVAACVLALLPAGRARGEGLRVHGRVNAAMPATGPQSQEQSWGALTGAMLELPLVPQIGVGLEIGSVTLSDGAAPQNPQIADEQGASGMSGALAVHIRPGASNDPGQLGWHSGLWSGSSVGVMRSNGLLRMMSEVNLGFDFLISDGAFAAGPSIGWLHVFQPDDALRPQDANVLSIGLHALFDTATKRPVEVVPVVESDRDADGIVDTADRCPNDAEDVDTFQDDDGCPDLDNDSDGILDASDQCPIEAEDDDGFEDGDGCPDPDNDGDGVVDGNDDCPSEAEDRDGFQDGDGCPDLDNDADGNPDSTDACPNEAEIVNGYADEDGCPDSEQVRVIGDKIILDERIHFRTNSSLLRSVSHPLLLRAARLLNDHPEYIHIEVQGHADARGDSDFNQRLSERRATAVMDFLIERGGVDASRLHASGYGTAQPLVESQDQRALYLNRRVEFSVTRRPSTETRGSSR